MNTIEMVGRLAREPQLQTTGSGVPYCNTSVAVDRSFSKDGKREADFFNIVAWRHNAEFLSKYFTKGRWVHLVGEMQSRKYTGKDGIERTVWEVIVDKINFAGDRAAALNDEAVQDAPPRRRASDFGDVEDDNHVPF